MTRATPSPILVCGFFGRGSTVGSRVVPGMVEDLGTAELRGSFARRQPKTFVDGRLGHRRMRAQRDEQVEGPGSTAKELVERPEHQVDRR